MNALLRSVAAAITMCAAFLTPLPAVSQTAAAPAELVADAVDAAFAVADGDYVPPAPAPVWHVRAATSLKAQITQWADDANWSVYWSSADDWEPIVDVSYTAPDFRHAVERLLDALPPGVPLYAHYNEANTPKLLTITATPKFQQEH